MLHGDIRPKEQLCHHVDFRDPPPPPPDVKGWGRWVPMSDVDHKNGNVSLSGVWIRNMSHGNIRPKKGQYNPPCPREFVTCYISPNSPPLDLCPNVVCVAIQCIMTMNNCILRSYTLHTQLVLRHHVGPCLHVPI